MDNFKKIDGKLHKKVVGGYRRATPSEEASYGGGAILGILVMILILPFSGVHYIFTLLFGEPTYSRITGNTRYELDTEAFALPLLIFTIASVYWIGRSVIYWKQGSVFNKAMIFLFLLICFIGCNSF